MIDKKIEIIKTILKASSYAEGEIQDGLYVLKCDENCKMKLLILSQKYKDIVAVFHNTKRNLIPNIPTKINHANISTVLMYGDNGQ
jgi:hypothetical protein